MFGQLFCKRNLKGRYGIENPHVDWTIIFVHLLQKYGVTVEWIDVTEDRI
jgi:hypothetical protein